MAMWPSIAMLNLHFLHPHHKVMGWNLHLQQLYKLNILYQKLLKIHPNIQSSNMDKHGFMEFPHFRKVHGVLPQKLKCGLKIPKFSLKFLLVCFLLPSLTSPYAWNLETIIQALDFWQPKKNPDESSVVEFFLPPRTHLKKIWSNWIIFHKVSGWKFKTYLSCHQLDE